MRLLPLALTFALLLTSCSTGAGMQATPPASISQTGGSSGYGSAPMTTKDSADAADAATDGAPETDTQAPPISQSMTEAAMPTGAGGRFLLD